MYDKICRTGSIGQDLWNNMCMVRYVGPDVRYWTKN